MNDFWEPWQPVIGDRVRVRINPECPYCQENLPEAQRTFVYGEPRDGRAGTVEEIRDNGPAAMPGHRYFIRWDRPIPVEIASSGSTWVQGSTFAALELRPA
jgi:hypothetical protein